VDPVYRSEAERLTGPVAENEMDFEIYRTNGRKDDSPTRMTEQLTYSLTLERTREAYDHSTDLVHSAQS